MLIRSFIILLFSLGCSQTKKSAPTVNHPWIYQLQNYQDHQLEELKSDLLVIDAYKNGFIRWPKRSILNFIKNHKLVFSYLSIGEAEQYRPYFKTLPKDILKKENKNWEGNFRIKYWEKQWQQIMVKELMAIAQQGFDGVYLDIVDAFHDYPKQRKEYAKKMANFILNLKKSLKRDQKEFKFIIQNGIDIIHYLPEKFKKEFINAIYGISLEAAFFNYKKSPPQWFIYPNVKKALHEYQNAGKFVLSVEYIKNKKNIKHYFNFCQQNDLKPLITDPLLKGLYFDSKKY